MQRRNGIKFVDAATTDSFQAGEVFTKPDSRLKEKCKYQSRRRSGLYAKERSLGCGYLYNVVMWDVMRTENRLVCRPTSRLVELWIKLEYVCSSRL